MEQALRDVTAFQDRIEQFLANLTATSDLSFIEESIPESYEATFCGEGMESPVPCTREQALEGLRQGVKHGMSVRCENRMIRMRSETEAVVVMDLVTVMKGEPMGRMLQVETLRLIDGAWKLVRETKEQVAL